MASHARYALLLLAGLLAACHPKAPASDDSSTSARIDAPAAQAASDESAASAASGASATSPASANATASTAQTGASPAHNEGSSRSAVSGPPIERSIYFGFDSDLVDPRQRPLLAAHARYLLAHPRQRVLIQGNTDERGTSEYNLALGQQRSERVLRTLEALGVPDSQLEAVSFGKEKPLAAGHDEASWAQNRRTDLVYR